MSHDFAAAYAVDVSQMTERKGGQTYLSWVHAVRLLKQADPAASWSLVRQEGGALYIADPGGAFVEVSLTFLGREYRHIFPVLDHRNKPVLKPDGMALNKAQMRGATKLIAMTTGYGLHVYAGEDMPSEAPMSDDDRREQARREAKAAVMPWLAPACEIAGCTYDELNAWVQTLDKLAPLCQPELACAEHRVIGTVIRGLGIGKGQGGRWVRDPDAPTERFVELQTWLGKRGEQ